MLILESNMHWTRIKERLPAYRFEPFGQMTDSADERPIHSLDTFCLTGAKN